MNVVERNEKTLLFLDPEPSAVIVANHSVGSEHEKVHTAQSINRSIGH